MINLYQPNLAKIIRVKNEIFKVKKFTLKFLNKKLQKDFYCLPGQFVEVGLPGFGEGPFASSSAFQNKDYFELCIKSVGQLTEQLCQLKAGDQVFVRGPLGNGFPNIKDDKEALLIAGGLGIIPLRSLILTQMKKKLAHQLTVFYGVKTAKEFLFQQEFIKWQQAGLKLFLIIDEACPGWNQCIGRVTALFEQTTINPNQLAMLCGPPVMYRPVLEKLFQAGVKEENIYLSLERRMHCGVGTCQHCAIGSKYVCKDGPVFRYVEIKDIWDAV